MNATRSMSRRQGRKWRPSASSREQEGFKPKPECEIVGHTRRNLRKRDPDSACFFVKKRGLRHHQVITEVNAQWNPDHPAGYKSKSLQARPRLRSSDACPTPCHLLTLCFSQPRPSPLFNTSCLQRIRCGQDKDIHACLYACLAQWSCTTDSACPYCCHRR